MSIVLLLLGVSTTWAQVEIRATHYGESYNGRPLGCGGTYWSSDSSIVAVGYHYTNEWPCGSTLTIDGPVGTIQAIRQDTCPGCGSTIIDLSEAGIIAVCGSLDSCTVTVRRRE